MELREYQTRAGETAIYPMAGTGSLNEFAYLGLGLASEAGEVGGKIKKLIRDGEANRMAIIAELGDVAWYWARLCSVLGVNAEDVIEDNLKKLLDRKERGVLGGNGDTR